MGLYNIIVGRVKFSTVPHSPLPHVMQTSVKHRVAEMCPYQGSPSASVPSILLHAPSLLPLEHCCSDS